MGDLEPLVGGIFASNPVLLLFKFPEESRKEHTQCSVSQWFLMTGGKGPRLPLWAPRCCLRGLFVRKASCWAGPRGSLDGCLGAGLGCLVPRQPCLTLYTRGQGFQVRPRSEHTGTSSVGQDPESISESSAPLKPHLCLPLRETGFGGSMWKAAGFLHCWRHRPFLPLFLESQDRA